MSGQKGALSQPEHVDVLIVTAVKDEYDAVLKINAGALPSSTWVEESKRTGLHVAFRTFQTADGGTLRFCVARTLEMGGVATANAAVPLVNAYQPRCIAMCGVCAGRKGDVELGDVILADRLWTYDTGKLKVEIDSSGKRIERVQGDVITYNLPAQWKQKAETFVPDQTSTWLSERPRTYDFQIDWLLECLLDGGDPGRHADRKEKCADYSKVLELLWKRKWLKKGSLNLTKAGRQYIEQQRIRYPDGLPNPKPFKIHVGPIGTGSQVVQDPQIFERLSDTMRKVLGLEMEASAIGAIAHLHQVPSMIVLKGVMDFADSTKSDNFKSFAARASAECLIAFLCANPPPPSPANSQNKALIGTATGFDDLLEFGTATPLKDPSPAALLNARYRHVPFFEAGRSELLNDLRNWCENSEYISVRLFHGAGGMGKTRLFIEWCERLRKEHWNAGFLLKSAEPARFEALLSSECPTLLVIDYAESRAKLGELLQRLAHHRSTRFKSRMRIALLARTIGDWWQDLLESDTQLKELLRSKPPVEVTPLVTTESERHRVFLSAAQDFASIRQRPPPSRPPLPLGDPRFERVLYIHMAALATVEGWPSTAESLMEDTVEHEEHFWLTHIHPTIQTDREKRLFKERARRAVTAVTLTGGVTDRSQAETLISRVTGSRDDALLLLLHDLYPGTKRGVGHAYLSSLEPDLLGEAMVLRTLKKESGASSNLLDQVFDCADERALRTGFEVLGRISVHYADEASHWIASILKRDVEGRAIAAFEAEKAVGQQTPHSILGMQLAAALEQRGTFELALRIEKNGLPQDTVSLREVVSWVTSTILHELPTEGGPELLAERASRLNDLGVMQHDLGQYEAACTTAQEAVNYCRRLASISPNEFLPQLARSLSNLSNRQLELGQYTEALASSQESVEIRRNLNNIRPGIYSSELAISLNTLGGCHTKMRQYEEALEALQESVSIRRELVKLDPDLLPDLAISLTNLGTTQSELEKHEAALASLSEAVSLRRKLTETYPNEFLPRLALSLGTLGTVQKRLGQYEAALAPTQEAVSHYRKLAEVRPNAFLAKLAANLNNLSLVQSKLGQNEAALASAQESVNHYRRSVEVRSDALLADLANSLSTACSSYSTLGRHKEALSSVQEAVTHYRTLANTAPSVFLPDLAKQLVHLASVQLDLEQYEEALASIKEVITHYRELADNDPEIFISDLAFSLNMQSALQSDCGQPEEALASAEEALDVLWPVFLDHQETLLKHTQATIENVSSCLQETKRSPTKKLMERFNVFRIISGTSQR